MLKNKGTFFVLGIDAATWSVITPNLNKLMNFKRLIEIGKNKVITLTEKPISASVWCGMFSGKLPAEHKHESYVVNGDIAKRADIKVDFIISDHGFCSFGDAKVQTLPQHTKEGQLKLKGDHHEDAFLVTVNVDYEIERPQDVFFAVMEEVR
jgi:hypothetical protein